MALVVRSMEREAFPMKLVFAGLAIFFLLNGLSAAESPYYTKEEARESKMFKQKYPDFDKKQIEKVLNGSRKPRSKYRIKKYPTTAHEDLKKALKPPRKKWTLPRGEQRSADYKK